MATCELVRAVLTVCGCSPQGGTCGRYMQTVTDYSLQ